MVKLNIGTWLFHTEGRTGIGFTHGDENGVLIEARASSRRGLLTPILAKLYALQEALIWIEQLKFERVIIETDCSGAIDMI